jgi:hypothetical protein
MRNTLGALAAYGAFGICSAMILATAVLAPVVIHEKARQLDRATRIQCATQDWPAEKHQAHIDFCRTYLAER